MEKHIVEALYDTLAFGESEVAAELLAPDLEWWFHGPPRRHHMMRVLTGEADPEDFLFLPRSIVAVGGGVIVAEGWEEDEDPPAYWVHVWTVEGGVISSFREYFDTTLTVRELRLSGASRVGLLRRPKSAPPVWQSEAAAHLGRSLLGLVLAL